jgi:hypothetical protein
MKGDRRSCRDMMTGASHIGMSINTYEALWSKKGKDR